MIPGALYVGASGRILDALRIAKAFAGERGGIATFPELVEACLDRPDHLAFDKLTLTSSIVAFGRVQPGEPYQGCVAHRSGFLDDPAELMSAGEPAFTDAHTRHLSLGSEYTRISPDRLRQLMSQPESVAIPIPCDEHPRSNHPPGSINTRALLKRNPRALLGPNYAALIARRKLQVPEPQTGDFKWDKWNAGNVDALLSWEAQIDADDFCSGAYALVSPLVFFLDPGYFGPAPGMTATTWPRTTHHLLVWRDRADRSSEILKDPDNLAIWKLGREDCFHPTDEALPTSPVPYIIGHQTDEPTGGSLAAYRVIVGTKGLIGAEPDPLCSVDVEEVFGEHILEDFSLDRLLSAEIWTELMDHAPQGTQAVHLRTDRMQIKNLCTPFGHHTVAERLPVEFVRIRPRHARRYLTTSELLADPEAYLRRIGVRP